MSSQHPTRRHPRFTDLTGKRFGKWLVISEVVGHHHKSTYWRCRCDCGTEKVIRGSALTGGKSNGCKPCSKRQHGMCDTPEYTCWKHMRTRCMNPACSDYPEYGGSGVTVCERWKSFENFLSDMGNRPSPEHSIDRIDGDGIYEPSNCRWATPMQQSQNRSSIHNITYDETTLCLAAWSRHLGIRYGTLYDRVITRGIPFEKAVLQLTPKG